MNKLYTFGCSYTEGFSEFYKSPMYLKYKEFNGGVFPKSWPDILAEKLKFDLVNYGEGAAGNQQIFNIFSKKCRELQKGDIVIIEWSFIERYRLALDNENWIKLGPGKSTDAPISEKTHEEILLNRTLKPYVDEIYDYENIIDFLCESIGVKVYYWTIISDLLYNQPKELLLQEKYLLCDKILDRHYNTFRVIEDFGGKKIKDETLGLINDDHMSKSGHLVQAELFYEHIMNYKQK